MKAGLGQKTNLQGHRGGGDTTNRAWWGFRFVSPAEAAPSPPSTGKVPPPNPALPPPCPTVPPPCAAMPPLYPAVPPPCPALSPPCPALSPLCPAVPLPCPALSPPCPTVSPPCPALSPPCPTRAAVLQPRGHLLRGGLIPERAAGPGWAAGGLEATGHPGILAGTRDSLFLEGAEGNCQGSGTPKVQRGFPQNQTASPALAHPNSSGMGPKRAFLKPV